MAFIATVRRICAAYPTATALRLIAAYARLVVRNRLPLASRHVERLLSFKVSYPHRPHFFGTVVEVFFQRIYRFPDEPLRRIVDAGANIGIATLYFKWRYPDAEVVCFEPNPEAFEHLEKNIRDNCLCGVTTHPFALGTEDGHASFVISASARGSTSAALSSVAGDSDRTGTAITVPVRRLSAFINAPVDLLKLDVEGAEGAVLEELEQAGALSAIRHMVIEYHLRGGKDDYPFGALLTILDRNGFSYRAVPQFKDVPAASSKKLRTYLVYATRHY